MKTKIVCSKHHNCDDLKIEQEWLDDWNNSINYTVIPCQECQREYDEEFKRLVNHLLKISSLLNIEYMDGDFPIEETIQKINDMRQDN